MRPPIQSEVKDIIQNVWLRLLMLLMFCVAFVSVTPTLMATSAYDKQCPPFIAHESYACDASCDFAGVEMQPAGENRVNLSGPNALLAVFSKFLAAETTAANTPLALGLTDSGLAEFAQARGATIATGENWQSTVLNGLADPNTMVHFNLNGVDVWPGVQRAASGLGGPTDRELLQIQQSPQSWSTLQFWKGGQPVANPFK